MRDEASKLMMIDISILYHGGERDHIIEAMKGPWCLELVWTVVLIVVFKHILGWDQSDLVGDGTKDIKKVS